MTQALSTIDSPEALLKLLVMRGGESYFGEPVTVLEHCLQAAHFAEAEGSAKELVVAALLHDVGHLLHQEEEDVAERGLDTRHEELGCQLLAAHLPLAVTEPIRLHVAAKRYLCFANAEYLNALSPSSELSLRLQGGPMNDVEAQDFLRLPFAADAVALRRWDDMAKIEGLEVPGVEAYAGLLKALWQ
jgi:[1-hydroxy-2-(trimethylamino)ethyl]phosphonate dioxygenase